MKISSSHPNLLTSLFHLLQTRDVRILGHLIYCFLLILSYSLKTINVRVDSSPHKFNQNLGRCFGDFLLFIFCFFLLPPLLFQPSSSLPHYFNVFSFPHLTSTLLSLKYLVWVACKGFCW
jgi:hypothetical protein